jgi:hypothetical protein
MDFQKENYGFKEEHFKDMKTINNDIKFLVKFFFTMEIWLMINSIVTYVQA